MEAIEYWKFSTDLSVIQAALLIIGKDPTEYQEYIDNWNPQDRPQGYDAILSALKNDILKKRLPAHIVKGIEMEATFFMEEGEPLKGEWMPEHKPNWNKTTISIDDLKQWLKAKNVMKCFFFEENQTDTYSYLNRANPCYAPKLEAAIRAWEAVTENTDLLRNKSPKQALEEWLSNHAEQFGLIKEDGTLNKLGIEDVSKISNWSLKGGANKTPTQINAKKGLNIPQNKPKGISLPTPEKAKDIEPPFDDSIPF